MTTSSNDDASQKQVEWANILYMGKCCKCGGKRMLYCKSEIDEAMLKCDCKSSLILIGRTYRDT